MVFRARPERLAGTEHRGRKFGMVRRVGIVLRFKRNTGILAKILSRRLRREISMHVLRSIHLHAGFGRLDEKRTAGDGITHERSILELAVLSAKNKVVVVPVIHGGEGGIGLHEICRGIRDECCTCSLLVLFVHQLVFPIVTHWTRSHSKEELAVVAIPVGRGNEFVTTCLYIELCTLI